jgi:hypothetical protein
MSGIRCANAGAAITLAASTHNFTGRVFIALLLRSTRNIRVRATGRNVARFVRTANRSLGYERAPIGLRERASSIGRSFLFG